MQAYGGISVVNALPSWYGSAMAVDMKVNVRVREGKRNVQDLLLNEILNYFERQGIPELEVEVESEIPPGSGLKSSSAVSNALIGEIAERFSLNVDIPKLSAILSLKAGVSFTGALDDAVASWCGGVSFTYNKEFKVIKRERAPRDVTVVILERSGKGKIDLGKLRAFRALFQEIFAIALQGRLWEAMKLNGIAIAEILGFPTDLVEEALRKGALASGLSGNGPSYFAVTREGDEGPVIEAFEKRGKVRVTRVVDLVRGN
ncbi:MULTISPECIES: shikimate kinase [Metallosphaera]|nr:MULTISPECIES: shikimate kinase [Metallosphaera]AKV74830.1 shikimate kinase [Metallosphaera sedula]AKV77066.1 shikimate kinase [Metallosphaera sedula]AKV79318.1 shikimate kinase [Metallosphaera sedula]AKV81563.1 shikimate kinase [Metallosphaera sedula]AKV83796.1 shikimate kinase [Metallosphaera sedula]